MGLKLYFSREEEHARMKAKQEKNGSIEIEAEEREAGENRSREGRAGAEDGGRVDAQESGT